MKRFNNAFTLTELLVALGVVGILCAILLPVIFNLLPNQNTVMAKRAYYLVQSVIADLINDEACYPDLTSATTDKRVGFDDGAGYPNCRLWGGEYNTNTINTPGNPNTKFVTLFTDKIDLSEDFTGSGTGTVKFSTKDGMDWAMTSGGFTSANNPNAKALLVVDVNGKSEPNCGQNSTAEALGNNGSCANRTSGWDRYTIEVYADGKIDIADQWAKDAVKVNKNISE